MSDQGIPAIDGTVVFVSDKRPYTVREVIDGAHFRGELDPAWNELLRLLAAEAKADAQELEYDDAAIDLAAERFRYDHDLITAEETERWLAQRGLGLADFGAYFVRHYWGEQLDEVEPERLDYFTAPQETRETLIRELFLSGELDRMALRLSWRVAALAGNGTVEPQSIAEERSQFLERQNLGDDDVVAWLAELGRDDPWLGESLRLEAAYHRDCRSVLSREACEREIAALRLPLTRFEVETIELDSLNAAREALLCAREDGMSMEEVAAEGRYPYRHPELLLEQIPEDLQQKFLSVRPGQILEPIPRGDGFHLCRIVGKAEPDLEDPEVRQRAEDRILERHFGDLVGQHVQWRFLPA